MRTNRKNKPDMPIGDEAQKLVGSQSAIRQRAYKALQTKRKRYKQRDKTLLTAAKA